MVVRNGRAFTLDRVEDFSLSTSAGEISFDRTYISLDLVTDTARKTFTALPRPFGSSPTDTKALRWTSNFFSFVDRRTLPDGGGLWNVFSPEGETLSFSPCTSSDCWATPVLGNTSGGARLRANAGQFELSDPSRKLIYSNSYADGGWVFLSSIQNGRNQTLATLAYAIPDAGTCWPPPGSTGTPYLWSVTMNGGQQLGFHYTRQQNLGGSYECVVNGVDAIAGSAQPLARYTYAGGLISSATTYEGSDGGVRWVESYDYTSGYQVTRGGLVLVSHLGTEVDAGSDSFASYYVASPSPDAGTTCPANTCCIASYARTAQLTAQYGDGTTTDPNLTRKYAYLAGSELLSVTESCSGGGCSSGTTQYLSRNLSDAGWGLQCDAGGPTFTAAVKDKRGNWTSSRAQLKDGGFELSDSFRGAPDDAGVPNEAAALERVNYGYSYNNNVQSIATESRPSTVQSGSNVVTTWYRNSTTNAPERVDKVGFTKLLDGSTQQRTSRNTWEYDGSGRVTRVSGPCDDSLTPCGASAPSTEYEYHSAAGSFSSGRLWKVKRRYNNGAAILTTIFEDYTPLGEPQRVTDENGVVTLFGYNGHNVVSRKIDLANDAGVKPEWRYAWENDKLTSIGFPEGNYEVLCYRAATWPSCSGAWVGRLTSRTKAADINASSWSERVQYEYWPDGSIKSELRRDSTEDKRFEQFYAADPHGRPTQITTGSGTGAFTSVRAHDGADNLAATGDAYNLPPAFCGAPGALSTLCGQLGYDRADRLAQVDTFPSGTSSPTQRACLDYDEQGNVKKVTMGCSSSDTCGFTAGTTSCGGVPANSYVTDDFGNVVEARVAGTDDGAGGVGVFRFEFDVRGNLIKQQTEVQRSVASPARYVKHEYDQLNRRTATKEVWGGSTEYLVSRWSYDDDSTSLSNPPAGCGLSPLRTLGRLRAVRDPLLTRWYQYDPEGRVTMEIRVPTGATTCEGGRHLGIGYSANGNLRWLRYGHGREVTYNFGTGATTDREVSVLSNVFLSDGGTATRTLVNKIEWEPYGGLRWYAMRFPGTSNTAVLERELGTAASALPSACPTAPLGESNDRTGRVRSIRVSDGSTNIYNRTYVWRAGQVERINSCYLGGPDAITEVYAPDAGAGFGYDSTQQLIGVKAPTFDTNGGPMREARSTYDSRGNTTSVIVTPWGHGYALQYDGGTAARRDWLTRIVAVNGSFGNRLDVAHDRDGRITMLSGDTDSSGQPPRLQFIYDSPDAGLVGPGSDTVMATSARSTGAYATPAYTYWYDPSNRRQAKVYPINNATDLFLYDLGHQLLEDRGLAYVSGEGAPPIDEYVWLGGSPIAVFRGGLQGSPALSTTSPHRPDDTGTCTRLNDGVACGVYFIVTDHIGKPVLALNGSRKISSVGEYTPSGSMNRVEWWWSTSNPQTKYAEGPYFLAYSQKELGMEVAFRNHFPLVDTEQDPCNGNVIREGPSIWNGSLSAMYEVLGGYSRGDRWSQWWPGSSSGGWRSMNIGWGTLAGNCDPTNCSAGCPQPAGQGWSYAGFVHREYEYRRFEAGVTPYFPKLRFPGHYFDEETDLNENWHRYYSPFLGSRYLSPEPLLQDPDWVARDAQHGTSVPTYAYAGNNSASHTDPRGLYRTKYLGECPNWNDARALAEKAAGCGTTPTPQSCQCQEKIASCGGCDPCAFLKEGQGPFAFQVDLDNWLRRLLEGRNDALARRVVNHAVFDDDLCSDPRFVEVLAGLMIHEGLHLCGAPSLGPATIDDQPGECSAEFLGDECMGLHDF